MQRTFTSKKFNSGVIVCMSILDFAYPRDLFVFCLVKIVKSKKNSSQTFFLYRSSIFLYYYYHGINFNEAVSKKKKKITEK